MYMIYIRRQRASIVGSGMAGSTLEIDSGHKNKKIGYYPKSIRPFLRILYVVDDSIYARRRNFSCAPGDLARNSD